MLSDIFSRFSCFGFSGSRVWAASPAPLSLAASLVPSGSHVCVGCARGVDGFFRVAFSAAEVFAVSSGRWGSGRGAFAGRSVACVGAVASSFWFVGFFSGFCLSCWFVAFSSGFFWFWFRFLGFSWLLRLRRVFLVLFFWLLFLVRPVGACPRLLVLLVGLLVLLPWVLLFPSSCRCFSGRCSGCCGGGLFLPLPFLVSTKVDRLLVRRAGSGYSHCNLHHINSFTPPHSSLANKETD